MTVLIVLLVIVLLVVIGGGLYLMGAYNGLVKLRNKIESAFAQIDVQLNRRHDLIPNLVETVKGYATHERTTLEAVTVARSRAMGSDGNAAQQSSDENVLVGALKSLLAVSEAYPDLLANQHFAELQHELTVTENRIQAARRIFNGNVRDYNTRVESVPSNLIARLCHLHRRSYFEIDAAVRESGAPTVHTGSSHP